MIANKKLIRQCQKIKDNLQGQVEECEADLEAYQLDCKLREDARIYYDHYRLKMQGLNEKAAKKADKPVTSGTYAFSSQTKEQEKLMRNQMKFEFSENEFKASSVLIDKKCKALLGKLDQVKINLSVRFFDKITRQFYEAYDKVHAKMANAQSELNDIVTEITKA